MLRITTVKKRRKVVLSVEGRLAGPSVGTLEQCWRELRAASTNEKFSVNLCGVSFIDAGGKVLLKEIHRQGGQLVAEGCLNQAIVREIVRKEIGRDREANRGRGKGSHIIFYLAFFGLLATPNVSRAQGTPKPSPLPAREEVEQARGRFKEGAANNIEVIQAQDALARANDNQIAALNHFNQARAGLARAIGQMEEVHAK